MAKKRRSPRKRADTKQQVDSQLVRYTRLMEKWIGKSVEAAKKVDQYRKKAAYYQQRHDEMEAAEAEQRERAAFDAGRELRTIDLDGGGGE